MHKHVRSVRDGILILRVLRDASSGDSDDTTDDVADDVADGVTDDRVTDDRVAVGSKEWLRRLSQATSRTLDQQISDIPEVEEPTTRDAEWVAYRCSDGVIQTESVPTVESLALACLRRLTALASALEQRDQPATVRHAALDGCPWHELAAALAADGVLAENALPPARSGDAELTYEIVEYSVTRIRLPAPGYSSSLVQPVDERTTLRADATLVGGNRGVDEVLAGSPRLPARSSVDLWAQLGVAPSGMGGFRQGDVRCEGGIPPIAPLSQREREVLALVAAGASNHQIAHELVIALTTVKRHLCNIYAKLVVQSRTQAVAKAYALGLLDISEFRRPLQTSAS